MFVVLDDELRDCFSDDLRDFDSGFDSSNASINLA